MEGDGQRKLCKGRITLGERSKWDYVRGESGRGSGIGWCVGDEPVYTPYIEEVRGESSYVLLTS